jgi:tRNA threonylcarbamoyladenosine biosynthesis protein TsaE
MQRTFTLDQLDAAATWLLAQNPHKIILFSGDMGAGKTTFIKALAKALGVKNTTSSPTFSLVNEYVGSDGKPLYHFDVYRIKSESEALDMGIDEYLYSGHWCLIEWPEKIPNLVPDPHTAVDLRAMADGSRRIDVAQ